MTASRTSVAPLSAFHPLFRPLTTSEVPMTGNIQQSAKLTAAPAPAAAPAAPQDDLRRRFQDALGLKSGGAARQAREAQQAGRSKVGDLHGPAARKRSFRRKTG
ncbi:DUF5302 domain-containing protein [Streptomyces rubellomurinus]|uniref:DUF5302 domain-containing protein n=1 Tax=Streptomyces rubellomurinus (strain ATCC 31215) TaxID=359131 RepID=A0A0F2T669_STRR3|nr:DUF5302 domain-containing protein [Streptomyces rubellomurinus]KJS57916.1 hypothetical protein VM95_36640 [Streptomyces rubellomurinus]